MIRWTMLLVRKSPHHFLRNQEVDFVISIKYRDQCCLFPSDGTLTEYQLRDGKHKLLIRCLPTDATQRQYVCFKCDVTISCLCIYGKPFQYVDAGAQWGYLTVCQLVLGPKKKQSVQGTKWPTWIYVCLPDLIFTSCQQQGVKLMRLFHGPITTNPGVL